MRLSADSGEEEFVLNMTPMIDVVFLLLIFFLLATTMANEETELSVELPSAESGATSEALPEELFLDVLPDGRVLHGGRELSDGALAELLAERAARNPDSPVTIRGDRNAKHESIVRVLDACTLAGLANLSLGTTPHGGSALPSSARGPTGG